ncbi:MAG: Stp1/IreP family PP2C-type Ser/Thr phosphatase [Gemmatimonadaceae bacterium]|nr:Stp1/IreP family PP2C-type Ser/Thr phosphatase [Gemmatimonadaceae bacterium]
MTGPSTPHGDVIVHVFGRTDVGRTREHNEDTFIVADLTTMNASLQPEVRTHKAGTRGTLFMVADGMGGAAAGEVASAMATEVVLAEMDKRWRTTPEHDPELFAHALRIATEVANTRIHAYAQAHPENRGMGTTATIAGFLHDTLYVCQVGDSRAYLVRDGVCSQITKDQSLMQKLVEAGELTAEEAEVSERRNIILQALGPEPIVKVDLTSQQVKQGDVLVLCSDGLSGQVRAREIADVVRAESDLVQVCKKLIDLANEAGGPDNITVVAARFEGGGLPPQAEQPAHRVYRGSQQQRSTIPLDRSSVPALAAMDPSEMPTLETEVVTPRSTPAVDPGAATLEVTPRDKAPAVDPSAETVEVSPRDVAAGPVKVGVGGPAGEGPGKGTVEIAPARGRAPQPAKPAAKVDTNYLRFIFGGIAVLVLVVYLILYRKG